MFPANPLPPGETLGEGGKKEIKREEGEVKRKLSESGYGSAAAFNTRRNR